MARLQTSLTGRGCKPGLVSQHTLAIPSCSRFVGGTLLARATGHWRNAVTDDEYARQVRSIDSQAYPHDRGCVPSRADWEAAEAPAVPPRRQPAWSRTEPGRQG